MDTLFDTAHYRVLRAQLEQLEAAPVRDMPAIDALINALSSEQRRLKSLEGLHGNNPIEWRHGDPPPL